MPPKPSRQTEQDTPRRHMGTLKRRPNDVTDDGNKPIGTTGDLSMSMPNIYRGKLDDHEPRMKRHRSQDVRASAPADAAGEFAYLEKLDGVKYEEAVASLTPEQFRRYGDIDAA